MMDSETFYKNRASWLEDMWRRTTDDLNESLKRSNDYFLEYCEEREALQAEIKTLNGVIESYQILLQTQQAEIERLKGE